MEKAMYLGSWFLLGCIASSFISWLGRLHPALTNLMWVIYIFMAVGLGVALLTDDAVRVFLKLPLQEYYALLIAIAFSIVLGGVLSWLLG